MPATATHPVHDDVSRIAGRRSSPRRRTRLLASIAATALAAVATVVTAQPAQAAAVTIDNSVQPRDTAGSIVHAHGGGILASGGYFYWFGESRNADLTFRAVALYRSTDLKTWEFRRNVLTQASAPELQVANIERPKVIYNRSTGQYVMWMHKENGRDYSEARAAVATSPTIDGDYAYRGSLRPFNQHMSRDITAFVDDDGAGYMVSAARDNYDLHVYRLTSDYTNVAALVRAWTGDHREAPALFKRDGIYFMLTSGATGWAPNQQRYATATSLSGPWSGWADVGNATAYGSQTAFVLPVQGSQTTTYLYLGDWWGPGYGATYADSRYVWLPLRFPSRTSMAMDWYPQVTVDTATGVASGVTPPYVNLVARHSGKCADVVNASSAAGAEVIQYACGSGANQQWEARSTGDGYVRLVARHSGMCLDVADAATTDRARVIQYTCGAGANQQWQLQDAGGGYARLVARHSGKCLDVSDASTADSTRLIQYACSGGANQQWQQRRV
ncbi:RICIN domain-containing protein [Nucisporomicrobium flavum]|uniref:RICIN domain-containing protein n=1 Tax=Nucisporomicrobium flavum TaxID=2785915 RepID=UPI0018F54132|nr:RICIN domain-containing protein [Nucisporomicrobium flavum]